MKEMKPQRWWGVTYVGTSRQVMPDTIRRTRQDAQRACCGPEWEMRSAGWRAEWRKWHKRGCRAVRVTVAVDPQP